MDVSVVIPTLDRADLLKEQIRAVAAQDFDGEFEIVVVDNGSDGATLQVLAALESAYDNLRICSFRTQKGAAPARNHGVAVARGQIIAFCDDDDVVCDNWLRELTAKLRPGEIAAGVLDVSSLNNVHIQQWVGAPDAADQELYAYLGFLPFASTANCALHRSDFLALGGFDSELRMGEDVALSWKAQLNGFRIQLRRQAVVEYRFRDSLRQLARQARAVGRSDPLLRVKFESAGCPAFRWSTQFRLVAWLLVRGPQAVVSEGWRGRWVRVLFLLVGRVEGRLRVRSEAR
jgi:glycosyltransferase involved in cell wall biosynthesis